MNLEMPLIHIGQSCKVAVGVFSKPSHTMRRDVIRNTWGQHLSKTSGVVLFFVIDAQDKNLAPHEAVQLERERATQNDLLFLDVLGSTETSFAKILSWFSWVVDKTECNILFKTEDDTYVRLTKLMEYLSTKIEFASKKKYFGITVGSWDSNQPPISYMSGVGYGITRDVATWISKNKPVLVETQNPDAAMGILLSQLRNTTGLDYLSIPDAFEAECTPDSLLDSPALSHDFNMYLRFHDEADDAFCAHVHRRVAASSPLVRIGADDEFSFDSMARARRSPHDETDAPWNRSNRAGRYADISDFTHSLSIYSSRNWYPWLAITEVAAYGGAAVLQKLDPSETALRALVVERAQRVFQSVLSPCQSIRVVGTWLKNWGARHEYVANLICADRFGAPAADRSALVHVPLKTNGALERHSPVLLVSLDHRIAVVTPITCRLDTLRRFLATSGAELQKLPGARPRRLILAWSYCQNEAENFTAQELGAEVAAYSRSAPAVEVVQVFFRDGRLFSRARALNDALGLCADDDLVVILDVDVTVQLDFYLNCLAFARRGHSMYFPIMFSRFAPELIAGYVEVMGLSTGDWLNKPETITADTGLWRDFSLGMVGMFAADARAVGLFDADLEGWGNEDVFFFNKAQAAGYMNWRPYDLKEIHVYHPKNCTDLRGTDRYPMCLGSKFRLEGTQMQVAVALHTHREAAAAAAGPGRGG
jgi:hypothetical protein